MTRLAITPLDKSLVDISKNEAWLAHRPSQRIKLSGYAGTVTIDKKAFLTPAQRGLLRRLFDAVFRGITMDGKAVLSKTKCERVNRLDALFSNAIAAIHAHGVRAATQAQVGLGGSLQEKDRAVASYERAMRCDADPAGQLKAAIDKLDRDGKSADWQEIAATLAEPKVAKRLWNDAAAMRKVLAHCPDLGALILLVGNKGSVERVERINSDKTCRQHLAVLIVKHLQAGVEEGSNRLAGGRRDDVGALFGKMAPAAQHTVALAVARNLEDARAMGDFVMRYPRWRQLLSDPVTAQYVRGRLCSALAKASDFEACCQMLKPFLVPHNMEASALGYELPRELGDEPYQKLFAKLKSYDEVAEMVSTRGAGLYPPLYCRQLDKALQANSDLRERLAGSLKQGCNKILNLLSPDAGDSAERQSVPDWDVQHESWQFGRNVFSLLTGSVFQKTDWPGFRTIPKEKLSGEALKLITHEASVGPSGTAATEFDAVLFRLKVNPGFHSVIEPLVLAMPEDSLKLAMLANPMPGKHRAR